MGHRDCAVMGLLCMAVAQIGCASKLDFDQVSAGHPGPAKGVPEADAGRPSAASTAEAGALDATTPVRTTPHDAAVLETGPTAARDGAADSGLPEASVEGETSAFSCKTLSPEPYFCDDFEGPALIDHWDDVTVGPTEPVSGGWIEIDGSAARAGQDSLLVQVQEGVSACDNCIGLLAGLRLPDLQGPTKLTAEFDLRVEQIDPTVSRRIVLFQVLWGTPAAGFTQHTLQLESRGGSVRTGLVEFATPGQTSENEAVSSTPFEHEFEPIRALARWVHVAYTLHSVDDATATGNVARLTVDDVVLFEGVVHFALHNASVRMEIGVPWVDMSFFSAQDTSKSWRVRYDNVLVRNEPR